MIDKDKVREAIDGTVPKYVGTETLLPLDGEGPLEVVVEVLAVHDNIWVEIHHVYPDHTETSYIDEWEWVQSRKVDDGLLYYLSLSLPLSVVLHLVENTPDILFRYRGTASGDEGTIAIVHDHDSNVYTSIFTVGKSPLMARQSYGMAVVPASIYRLALTTGMSVASDISSPLHLREWRGRSSRGDTLFN